MIKRETKDLMIKLLKVLFPDSKVYLFGSEARGDAGSSSDIDIAIDIKRAISSLELARAMNIIESLNIPQTVDVVDFYSAPDRLKKIILDEGELWSS